MPEPKLEITLVGASILRESELPGYESISDFASESFNLAIASIKASVQSQADLADRVRVRLADFDVSWDRKTLGEAEADHVSRHEPDVVGLSCYCWSLDTLLDLASHLRRRLPRALIVLGGPSAGPDAELLLRSHPAVDAVVRGEGEDAFVSLLRARLSGEALHGVPGLSWRAPSGEIAHNDLPERPVDLEMLPSVYRSGVMHPGGASMFLETSRGCRFRCRFCSWMGGGRRLRYVPIDHVEADLRWAVDHDVRSVKLADTAINFHTDRLGELAEALRRADPGGKVRLTYFLKPELLTEQQVRLLERIPSEEIIVGVESLTPAARKAAGKPPFDPDAFERQMAWLSRVGPVTVSFILGLPGDSLDGLARTLDWIVAFDETHPGLLHVICLFWLAVLPGAALHQNRERLGLRLMPRETPYLLQSHEHTPDDLLRMARRSIEMHYGHPKLRVEYFHKEYLMQDAPAEDRKVSIPRVERDDRSCAVLVGAADPEMERSFGVRPYDLDVCYLEAFVEGRDEIRRRWRTEVVHATGEDSLEATLARVEAQAPSWVLWTLREVPSPRLAARLDALAHRTGATLVIHGARNADEARRSLEAVGAARLATVGEAEHTLARLLGGEKDPPGLLIASSSGFRDTGPPELVEDLDTLPSPFQWGFVQRPGPTIAMQLGRQGRCFGPERLYRDLRWAVEQRHDHVVWLDDPLPADAEVLRDLVASARRADPEGKVRHTYRVDGRHDAACIALLQRLPGPGPAVPWQRDAVEALRPLGRTRALSGWELLSLGSEGQEVHVLLRWQRSASVQVRLRGADPRNVRATVEVTGPRPPQRELRRLTQVVTRLLSRARLPS